MHAFIGEIRMFPYDYPPEGGLECDGALVDKQRRQALFSVTGHRFGGSGANAFLDASALSVAGVPAPGEIDIVQPYLALRACICADGERPVNRP